MIAGLWDEWRNPENNETLKSCTMVINSAEYVCRKDARLLVGILEAKDFERWERGNTAAELGTDSGFRQGSEARKGEVLAAFAAHKGEVTAGYVANGG